MLLPPSDLRVFNNMVTPIEVEAYDILKYRSGAFDPGSLPVYNHQWNTQGSSVESDTDVLIPVNQHLSHLHLFQFELLLFAAPRLVELPNADSSLPSQVGVVHLNNNLTSPGLSCYGLPL